MFVEAVREYTIYGAKCNKKLKAKELEQRANLHDDGFMVPGSKSI